MASIIDYMKKNKDTSFDDLALNDADILSLNEIGYIPFGEVLEPAFDLSQELTLRDVLEHYEGKRDKLDYNFIMTKERVDLLEEMISSQRFADLRLSHYVNDVDNELEKQFAAMIFRIPKINHTQIVFRGTDDTMVGWKEDFKLTYMREIPAHRSAIAYLKNYLSLHEDKVLVSGHSKGGNLAVYAVSHLPSELQDKIAQVYMFDAPGLHEAEVTLQSYQNIRDRLKVIRPEESIVGVMLNIDVEQEVVESQSFGVFQHAATRWQVSEETGDFVPAEKPTDLSLNLQQTFKQWTDELSNQELKALFDTVFDNLIDNGFLSLNELSHFNRESATTLFNVFNSLNAINEDKKNLMSKSAKLFFAAFAGNFKVAKIEAPKLNLPALPDFPDWEEIKSKFDKK
jgi:hypothetical protein